MEQTKNPDKEIHIEICQNCRLHRWCTRHDEKKYNQIFECVSQALGKELGPSFKILKNQKNPKPRIGAFEVIYKDKVIFSKIAKGFFPEVAAVVKKAKEIIENKDGEGAKEEEKTEKVPNNKKSGKKPVTSIKTKDQDFKIPKYDIICPSPTKIHRAYKESDGFIIETSNVQESKD